MNTRINQIQDNKARIEELTVNFSISKYNLLKISALHRTIEVAAECESNCRECANYLDEVENMIEEIPFLDQIDHRQPYEKKFNEMRTHIHKRHGFIQPHYYSSIFAIIGIVAGTLCGIVFSMLNYSKIIIDVLIFFATAAMLIAYSIGSIKDAKFRKAKRII